MVTNDAPITLATLGGGAAVEKFGRELEKVIENIKDPNTKPEAVREIVIKVKIAPDKDRSLGAISVSAASKLAPDDEFTTACALGVVGGKAVAMEFLRDTPLFGSGESGDNVVGIDQAKKKEE